MPTLLTMRPLAEGFSSALIGKQVAGVLDLMGLAVGIWTVWSSITLPLDGKLQHAFHLIGIGTLAFAVSHLIDSLVGDLRLLSSEQTLLLTQGTVLISMLFFIPGLAGLADVLPTLSSARRLAPIPRFWPLGIVLALTIVAFSFILFGISPEAEAVAFIALDSIILVIAGLSVVLLRTRIGGVIGRSLWLAMVGLLVFSLAHPLQVWLYGGIGLPDTTLAIVHRLIVMPSLMLFALSLTGLARKLSASLYSLPAQPTLPPSKAEETPKQERWKVLDDLSPRARARQHRERKSEKGSLKLTRPFPALRLRSGKRP